MPSASVEEPICSRSESASATPRTPPNSLRKPLALPCGCARSCGSRSPLRPDLMNEANPVAGSVETVTDPRAPSFIFLTREGSSCFGPSAAPATGGKPNARTSPSTRTSNVNGVERVRRFMTALPHQTRPTQQIPARWDAARSLIYAFCRLTERLHRPDSQPVRALAATLGVPVQTRTRFPSKSPKWTKQDGTGRRLTDMHAPMRQIAFSAFRVGAMVALAMGLILGLLPAVLAVQAAST